MLNERSQTQMYDSVYMKFKDKAGLIYDDTSPNSCSLVCVEGKVMGGAQGIFCISNQMLLLLPLHLLPLRGGHQAEQSGGCGGRVL